MPQRRARVNVRLRTWLVRDGQYRITPQRGASLPFSGAAARSIMVDINRVHYDAPASSRIALRATVMGAAAILPLANFAHGIGIACAYHHQTRGVCCAARARGVVGVGVLRPAARIERA